MKRCLLIAGFQILGVCAQASKVEAMFSKPWKKCQRKFQWLEKRRPVGAADFQGLETF